MGGKPSRTLHSRRLSSFLTTSCKNAQDLQFASSPLLFSSCTGSWHFWSHADIHLHSTSFRRPTHRNFTSFLLCVHPREKSELFSPHAGPPLLCILMQRYSFPFLTFTRRNFWVFPRCSFPCGSVDVVAVFFPHELIRGSCVVIFIHAQAGEL